MTTIGEYLQTKYQTERPGSMLACEARCFGIGWPLPSGWFEWFRHVEITERRNNRLAEGESGLINGLAPGLLRRTKWS